jgi:hypothetical protein
MNLVNKIDLALEAAAQYENTDFSDDFLDFDDDISLDDIIIEEQENNNVEIIDNFLEF